MQALIEVVFQGHDKIASDLPGVRFLKAVSGSTSIKIFFIA